MSVNPTVSITLVSSDNRADNPTVIMNMSIAPVPGVVYPYQIERYYGAETGWLVVYVGGFDTTGTASYPIRTNGTPFGQIGTITAATYLRVITPQFLIGTDLWQSAISNEVVILPTVGGNGDIDWTPAFIVGGAVVAGGLIYLILKGR